MKFAFITRPASLRTLRVLRTWWSRTSRKPASPRFEGPSSRTFNETLVRGFCRSTVCPTVEDAAAAGPSASTKLPLVLVLLEPVEH